jgi:group I intron endonuclease
MYTVYKITNAVNGKIYFGYTSKTPKERLAEHARPSGKRTYLRRAIHKYGIESFHIETLFEFESLWEATSTEIFLIARYRTNVYRFPKDNGMNTTDGGEGTKGPKAEDHKRKISEAHKGRKKTTEHVKNMIASKTGKGTGEDNPMWGRKHREDTIALFRTLKKTKKVNQYDLNGNFIKTFYSMMDAQRETGAQVGNIARCCRGLTKQMNGYIWRYA